MQTIKCDTRQHRGKHNTKHAWWDAHGVERERVTLPTGDYSTDGSNVLVDTKRGIAEIAGNICGPKKEHERVKREIQRASDAGCRLVFLIECVGYKTITDVYAWTNDRCKRCNLYRSHVCYPRTSKSCGAYKRKPVQGVQLAKAMQTMEERYGCRFEFVHPRQSARRICELLGVDYE